MSPVLPSMCLLILYETFFRQHLDYAEINSHKQRMKLFLQNLFREVEYMAVLEVPRESEMHHKS